MMKALTAVLIVLPSLSLTANAHDWYVGRNDPVTGGSCCTTTNADGYGDCARLQVDPGVLEPIPEGYRLRLTVEQARKINPLRTLPVDTIIPEERIQPSQDGNFHVCIPGYPGALRYDFFCFFRPNFS
jgi:hypothetical protein